MSERRPRHRRRVSGGGERRAPRQDGGRDKVYAEARPGHPDKQPSNADTPPTSSTAMFAKRRLGSRAASNSSMVGRARVPDLGGKLKKLKEGAGKGDDPADDDETPRTKMRNCVKEVALYLCFLTMFLIGTFSSRVRTCVLATVS